MTNPQPTTEIDTPPGYRDVSVAIEDIARSAMWLALALLIVPVLAFVPVHGVERLGSGLSFGVLLALSIPAFVVAVILHEGLHALGWMLFGRVPPQQIAFGVDRATLSPYAHVKGPMRATPYRIGALLPLIVLGILPWLWGMATGEGAAVLFAGLMLSAAVGDIYVVWVIREVPGGVLVMDHPTRAGCYVQES